MLIFIHGEDLYRCHEKFTELKKSFSEKVDKTGTNIDEFEGEKLDFDLFFQSARTFPFLAKRKMIIVRDFLFKNKKKDTEKKIIENLKVLDKEDNVIIFFESLGEKKGKNTLKEKLLKIQYHYHYPPLGGQDLYQWANTKINGSGLQIDSQALALLLSLTNNDLWALKSEIQKLVFYVKGKNKELIEKQDVELLVFSQTETNIFSLVDAMAARNKVQALKILHNLVEEGNEALAILAVLTNQFKNLLIAKSALVEQRDLYKIMKLPPFVIKKLTGQASLFSPEELKRIYGSLLNLDKRVKSGDTQVFTLYYLLVLCA